MRAKVRIRGVTPEAGVGILEAIKTIRERLDEISIIKTSIEEAKIGPSEESNKMMLELEARVKKLEEKKSIIKFLYDKIFRNKIRR